ncbi:MAG: hypothetical protein HYT72_04565 [Candidatus Aenigmarchaeota archaeon]|nr:hypothetical protein [Candidatus Aenigmarchaeota archaeon]
MPRRYDIQQLRQYCEEGASLQFMAEQMKRTPGTVVGQLYKLAQEDPTWRPFASRYSREHRQISRQRPLEEAEASVLIRYLMDYRDAKWDELEKAGFESALLRYPGGITQARKDAEAQRFLEAHRIYNEFVSDVASEVREQISAEVASHQELRLVGAVFGQIPYFHFPERLNRYIGVYMQVHPPAGLDYRSGITASLRGLFVGEVQSFLQPELRRIIDEALGTLNPEERRVLEARFLADRTYSREGLRPEFGVTAERLRQREIKALRKLRHGPRREKFEEYFRQRRNELFASVPPEYRDDYEVVLLNSVESLQHQVNQLTAASEKLQQPENPEDLSKRLNLHRN